MKSLIKRSIQQKLWKGVNRPMMAAASSNNYHQRTNYNMFFAGAMGTGATLYFMKKADEEAECASFSDKILDATMDKINAGIDEVIKKNPGMEKVKISYGLRGVRYFIEFPIVGRNVDAFSLLSSTQQKMESGKKDPKYMVKTVGNDSYINEENVAYLIDYKVRSKAVQGTNNSGSVYIRGVKGE